MLTTLVPSHPRLLIDWARIAELQALIVSDPLAGKAARDVCEQADAMRRRPPLCYPSTGSSMLRVSRDCLERVLAGGMAWLMCGRDEHAEVVRASVLTVCSFPDWGTREAFLEIAEMACAIGLAYDWLHARFSDSERATIRQAMITHAFTPGLAAYAERDWWVDTYINWNQVSHGGLIIAALAIADTDPAYANDILPRALGWLPNALACYEPDGGWMEGAGYWSYGTDYTAFILAALESALGTDFGIGERAGLRETGLFPLIACGPTGMWANFADVVGDRTTDVIGNRGRRGNVPVQLWLAKRYGRPEYAQVELEAMAHGQAQPLDLLWYRPELRGPTGALPLAKRFRGQVELACLRSAWDDPHALFAWIKAGSNQINHGHLDLGSFELDALGERWASDLGAESYSLLGYFDKKSGGKRWQYFRLNSASHNVPLIDGASQDANASAIMSGFSDDPNEPYAIIDYGAAYAPTASSARRGLMRLGARAVLVQDEFTLSARCGFTWGMTTDAAITVDGAHAELTLNGKRLLASILAPAGARFTCASAERPPPEKPNPGVRRLTIELPAAPGALRVAVLLAPCWPDGTAPAPALRPLAEW